MKISNTALELDYQEFVIDDCLNNAAELLDVSDEIHAAAMAKMSAKDQEVYRLGLAMLRAKFTDQEAKDEA